MCTHVKNSMLNFLILFAAGVEIILGKDLQTPKVGFCCCFKEGTVIMVIDTR
jgi:hypothetical protein